PPLKNLRRYWSSVNQSVQRVVLRQESGTSGWCRSWRSGELGGVNRNCRPHVVELYGRPAVEPGDGPTKRHFGAGDVAIIRVVDLRGIATHWRVGVAHEPHQQARFLVEVQLDRRLPGAGAL